MADAQLDANSRPSLIAVSNVDGTTPIRLYADPITHRLLVDLPVPSTGTVTSVSVVTANGFAGSVATATTTPAITLSTTITGILKGDGTAISAASAGTDYVTASSTNTFTNKTYDTAGTGNSFSINGVAVTANTGTGAVARASSPTFVTPTLGAATATSINSLTITTSTGTLTIANSKVLTANSTLTLTGTDGKTLTISNSGTLGGGDGFVLAIAAGKTLTASNSLTLAGTDSTVMTFPTTTATIARTDAAQTFTGVQTITNITLPTNGQILLTVPTTDGHATGPTTNAFNSGYSSSAVGDLVILDSSSTWQKTDANTASIYNGLIGIALEVKASGAALLVALPGSFVYATGFPTLTVGGTCYMSETAGAITQTAPVTTDAATRIIGYAIHADKIFFSPSPDWITHI